MSDGYFKKELKKKKCKECGKDYEPYSTLSQCCSVKCSLEYNRKKDAITEKRVWHRKKQEMKESLKAHSEWLKDLEKEINAIARFIDTGCTCVSCGGRGKPQAGHYHTVKAHGNIRFNLHNIHIQCYRCNVELSANMVGYDDGLIEVYGYEYWDYVKFEMRKIFPLLKPSIPEIKGYIKIAREIKKELMENPKKLPAEERVKLRTYLNERIGIYKTT